MKDFEIWIEGYLCTGMEGKPSTAQFLGTEKANSFREAVLIYYVRNPSRTFVPEKLEDWGCRLFDNEYDARKSFG